MSAGLSLGLAQSEVDAQSERDPDNTLGLFGRIGFTDRLSAQLELARTEPEYTDYKIRSITTLLVVDLGSRGPLVPILLVGVGVDEAQSPYGDTVSGSRIEGGFGLEYRTAGGLTLGADARMGGRSIEQSEDPIIAIYAPVGMQEGEYRTARVTLGVRF